MKMAALAQELAAGLVGALKPGMANLRMDKMPMTDMPVLMADAITRALFATTAQAIENGAGLEDLDFWAHCMAESESRFRAAFDVLAPQTRAAMIDAAGRGGAAAILAGIKEKSS